MSDCEWTVEFESIGEAEGCTGCTRTATVMVSLIVDTCDFGGGGSVSSAAGGWSELEEGDVFIQQWGIREEIFPAWPWTSGAMVYHPDLDDWRYFVGYSECDYYPITAEVPSGEYILTDSSLEISDCIINTPYATVTAYFYTEW